MTFNWNITGPNHYWSLAVEEHFYLFWPLLVYYLSTKGVKMAIFSIIAIALITRILLVNNGFTVFYFTLARIDELAIGALLAIWEVNGKLTQKNSKKYLLLTGFALIPTLLLWTVTGGKGMDIIQICKFILLSACYLGLIGFVITTGDSNFLKRFLKIKPLMFVGKISYGLYVYHPLCFYLINKYAKPESFFVHFIFSFTVAFIVSALSYYLFESKFLHLKKYFEYNTSNNKTAA